MRYLIVFVLFVASMAPALSASAQPEEQGETSEQNLVETVPAPEATPEEPALQLQLDDAGVQVASPPPRTPDGYTLEEMEHRVKRAKIGLGVSAGVYGLGLGLTFGGIACANNAPPPDEDAFIVISTVPGRCYALYGTGAILGLGGLIGMIMSGVRLARHKRDRNWLRQAQYGRLHQIQWDLARSRLVF